MADIQLMSITGAVSGIIGSVAGIGGAWVAHRANRRSLELKALDLRLEVRKAISLLINGMRKLDDLLPLAEMSRSRIASAAGMLDSGEMVNWKAQFDADCADLTDLKNALAVLPQDFKAMPIQHLEELLADLDVQAHRIKALATRYRDAIAEDDKLRSQARAPR